jgi:hypothetical protein
LTITWDLLITILEASVDDHNMFIVQATCADLFTDATKMVLFWDPMQFSMWILVMGESRCNTEHALLLMFGKYILKSIEFVL